MAYTTVHTFEMLGQYIAMDVASGAVHILDKLAYEVVRRLTPPLSETCPAELYAELEATREEIDEAYPSSTRFMPRACFFPKTIMSRSRL